MYYYLAGKMVSMRRENQQHAADPGDEPQVNGQFRVVGDQLGSTTLVVNEDATVIHREYYKPYGEVAYEYKLWHQSHRDIPTTFGYTGQRLDKEESGLMYYGARYYDPALSYFVSADPTVSDPKKSGDLNRYLYARGNPLRYIDQFGYGPDDYYIYVEGCPSGIGGCTGGAQGWKNDWNEYATQLYDLYRNVWHKDWRTFNDWAWGNASKGIPQHVFNLVANDTLQGASDIDNTVAGITGSGKIHLIGHSTGGAAILKYFEIKRLHEQINSRLPSWAPHLSTLDSRVASAIMIDSPLWCGVCQGGLGKWLANKGVQVLDVSSPKNIVQHSKIADIDYEGNPDYSVDIFGKPRPTKANDPDAEPSGPQGGLWPWDIGADIGRMTYYHEWTSTHGARRTGEFMRSVWGP